MVAGEVVPDMPRGGMRTTHIGFQAKTIIRTGCHVSVVSDTSPGIPTVIGMRRQGLAVMVAIRRRLKVNGMRLQALGAKSAVQ
jgi:hypothetical protein